MGHPTKSSTAIISPALRTWPQLGLGLGYEIGFGLGLGSGSGPGLALISVSLSLSLTRAGAHLNDSAYPRPLLLGLG